ncbi:Alpha-D-kanosaminyltransferase [Acaryochloris thomasi RCC1774]|uniref:Alpha-D-kanosaminyltransferase n=1 Tax=Acaryochloris thomasi RCC1774 TaxID=1764569 RepID=A0A2W1JP80_9CYAN|nr:glycosyltransferase family 4 protein [Acaryochloris thomasi]PZD75109.1 Alpha-D-kanosaminyltransferase [Acaryochloris thomasi RCC1774]
MPDFPLAYISFDIVPAPKGAAVHIEAFTGAIANQFGPLHLVSVSPTPEEILSHQRWPGVYHTALPALGKTLLDRVLSFRRQLDQWLRNKRFQAIHVRSIYEGFPIAQRKQELCDRLILEINGLPSIELKYRYPRVAEDSELMHKLLAQEALCLSQADQVITPSGVTKAFLVQQGVPADKIAVIPNGVDLSVFTYRAPRLSPDLQPLKMLYFGTLSAWQGVDLAIEALDLYCRDFPAVLTILGPARPQQLRSLLKLIRRLGQQDRVQILAPVNQAQLVQQMHNADVIVAPLKANDRNCIQGCCPLKILEGMASGTPVVTSDLDVVHALGRQNIHLLMGRPGSAKAIKDNLLLLRANPDLRLQLSQGARSYIERFYTWEKSNQDLIRVYKRLGIHKVTKNISPTL